MKTKLLKNIYGNAPPVKGLKNRDNINVLINNKNSKND